MAREARKPVIGLSLSLHDFGEYGGVGFQRPVALAGGVPLTLPRVDGDFLEDALDACDGILLGGGRDIDPSFYGQEPSEHLDQTEPRPGEGSKYLQLGSFVVYLDRFCCLS